MSNVVMVTGASAGVGRALAHRFASEGFDIVAVARRRGLLDTLAAEIDEQYGRTVIPICADLAEPGVPEGVYADVQSLRISVLINNAGIGDWNMAWDVGVDRLHSMIDLNVRALAVLSVLFARDNRDADAQLINVASAAGYSLFVGAAPYCATKFFVTSFTEGIEHDLRAAGALMQAKLLVPGPIDTEFTEVSLAESKLPRRSTSKVEFHTADEIAEFAYRLYGSDHTVGTVDPADMSFTLGDRVHPVARLGKRES